MRPLAKLRLVGAGYLAALALAGVVVTAHIAATSFFLRPVGGFWRVLAIVALAVAATAVAAVADDLMSRWSGGAAGATAWTALASLRVLAAPLFALAFVVAAVFAPSRLPRLALALATAIEVSVSYVGFLQNLPFQAR